MSNKMPKATAKKTKSALRVVVIVVGLVLVLGLATVALNTKKSEAPAPQQAVVNGCNGLQTNQGCYALERAESNAARMKGLSDRDNLAAQTGMLFVFGRPQEQCIWMKDMRFNIDIVWLNEAKEIVQIKENVNPDTYPESFCKADTKYVIELNANDTQKLQLGTGQRLAF